MAVYVAESGNDSNSGSEASPKLTLAAAMATSPDMIFLNKGDVWREMLTAIAGLSIKAYGTGDAPVISGANVVTGLVAEGTNSEGSGELGSADFDEGNLTDMSSISVNGSVTLTASTTQKRSGTHSMRLLGDSTDNRGLATKNFTEMASGDTRHFFVAVYVATGQLKNSTTFRLIRLLDGGASRLFVELNTNSSGVVTLARVNGHATNSGGTAIHDVSVAGVFQMGAWNTVELVYKTHATTGSIALYINGTQISTTITGLNTSGAIGVDQFAIGCDAFGAGPINGGLIYFDDLKISASPISSALNIGDPRSWSSTFTTDPSQVFVDGKRGERVASAAEVTSYRKWHWASNVLTVYGPVGGAEPEVEASVRAAAIDCNGADGVTIDGIRAERGFVCIDGDGCNDLTVVNSTIADAFVEGIRHHAEGGETLFDLTIEDNIVEGAGGTGIAFNMKHDGFSIKRNTIRYCCRLHHQQIGASAQHKWSAGIKWFGNELDDQFFNGLIEDNNLYDLMPEGSVGAEPGGRGAGIWGDHYYYSTPPASYEVVVRRNVVVRCQGWGLYGEKVEATLFEDNAVLYPSFGANGTGTTQFTAGAALAANDAPPGGCFNNEMAHITVIGGWWGIVFNNSSTASPLTGNLIRDSISDRAFQPSGPWDGERFYASTNVNGGGAFGSGNVVQNLNLGPDRSAMASWSGTAYATAAAFDTAQAAVSGMVSGDPLFVNPAEHDYRLDTGSPCIGAATDTGNLGASDAVLLRLAAIPAEVIPTVKFVAAAHGAASGSISVGPFTPPAGSKLLIFHSGLRNGSTDPFASETMTATGHTFTRTDQEVYSSSLSDDPWASIWTADATGATITITANSTGDTHRHAMVVYEVAEGATFGAKTVEGGVGFTTGARSVTFNAAPAADSEIVAVTTLRDWGTTSNIDVKSGWDPADYEKANSNGPEVDELYVLAQHGTGISTAGPVSINADVRGGSNSGQGYVIAAIEVIPPVESIVGSIFAQETGSDQSIGVGQTLVQGELAAQETGSDTAVATGSVVVSGSVFAQETGSDTSVATGSVTISGSVLSQETGSDTAFGTGSVAISGGALSQETGSDTAVATGSVTISGSVFAQETGSDTAFGTGSVLLDDISGSIFAQEIGSDTAVATGSVLVSGSGLSQETGSDTASGTGSVLVSGTISAQETGSDTSKDPNVISGVVFAQETGSDTAVSTGSVVVSGIASAQEAGSDTSVADGSVAISGDVFAQESGTDTLLASGSVRIVGSLFAQELGSDTAVIAGDAPVVIVPDHVVSAKPEGTTINATSENGIVSA